MVREVRTAYRRKGEGRRLLYLHGAGLTCRWLELHEELASDHDLIAPEHPGFGQTPRPRWYRSIHDLVLHYADFLDELGLSGRLDLVGHSFGGLLAGSFAATFPDRIRSLTLIAPGPLPTINPPFEVPEEVPADFDFDEVLFNGNQADYPDFRHADDNGDLLGDDDGDRYAAPPVDALGLELPTTLYRQLARVKASAQILVPDEDRLFGPEISQQWAAALGNPDVIRIEGAERPTGHLLVVQEPHRIAARVRELADKV
ncbi:alpha/beta fold hydrolase [Nonomuraea sp. NPDC026600]|uniref:alpha/beta fold hydrolase n=1 Tax=Nonomuraea sp. NPDC026600 TaxID=3155363 RepID=UPI0033DF70B8